MSDRLSSIDASFLHLEEPGTPMHGTSVMIFEEPSEGFDHDRLVALLTHRIAAVPRFRQRIATVPGGVANPVWVDDDSFDIGYHVRRSALPKPGGMKQLEELVARIASRPLDRSRPLWEVYLVEGMRRGRFAIITKSHHAMIDAVGGLDIAHITLTDEQDESLPEPLEWAPASPPSGLALLVEAAVRSTVSPGVALDGVRGSLLGLRRVGGRIASGLGAVMWTVARGATRPAPPSPLNAPVGAARRYVMVETDLKTYKAVRARLGRGAYAEEVTVNDVVLSTITGALRTWLLTRGEAVTGTTSVRAMVPVSTYDASQGSAVASRVMACFVDLPVGEAGASMRLHQIAFSMRQQMEGGQAVGATSLSGLAGFAPPTLHSLGARLGSAMSRRFYNVMVTNAPGPQTPLYAGTARMIATYPVVPLLQRQALSIGVTSYDGKVYYGLYGDRDVMPDLDVLGEAITDSLAELASGRETD